MRSEAMSVRSLLIAAILLAAMIAHGSIAGPSVAPPELAWAQMLYRPSILTFDRPEGQPRGHALTVTSSSFGPDGQIPPKFSGSGGSRSPQVSWTPGPAGTRSYVLLLEDGVYNRNGEGIVHWLVFNIPAGTTSIAEGVSADGATLQSSLGPMKQGANIDQAAAYAGMYGGPMGSNYRLQVFALDTSLELPSGATRDEVWEGMKGHVLASGQLMTYFRGQTKTDSPGSAVPAALAMTLDFAAAVHRSMYLPAVPTIHRPQGLVTEAILTVASPSFSALGPSGIIPTKYTARGASISPEVTWSKGPPGTKSYVLLLEDSLINVNGDAALHWLLYDIPAEVTHLPEGLSSRHAGMTYPVARMKEGVGASGIAGYAGMAGIAGGPSLHYHLQVFALDTTAGLPAGATRVQVWQAMSGHVLAKGQTVGSFQPLGPDQVDLPAAPRGR